MRPAAIENWHKAAKAGDAALLDDLLADDAVFQSPVVHRPQVGKAITKKYLESAFVVLNNATFRYLDEWIGPHSAVLEFQSTVNGIEINGVDIITWTDQDKITNFKVMVRPLKAVNMLHQMMAGQLGAPAPAQA